MPVSEVAQLKENRIQSMIFRLPEHLVQPKRETILIIEENQTLRELLTWVMIAGGYHPTVDGQPVDLIILDLDCSEAWRKTVISPLWEQLKSDTSSPLAIIFLTCLYHPIAVSGSLVIQKPFHVQVLLDAVTKALHEKNKKKSNEEEGIRFLSHFD